MVDYARIDFQNLSAIVRVFENRGARAMRELRAPIAEALLSEVLTVFETEGYGKWPGFAWQRRGEPPPGTPKQGPIRRGGKTRKRDRRLLKRGKIGKSNRRWQGNPKLLQDTGNLVGSLQRDWTDASVEVFTNVPYAKFHISPDPRHKIPLRDFFAIDTAKVEREIVDMFELHVSRPIAAE